MCGSTHWRQDLCRSRCPTTLFHLLFFSSQSAQSGSKHSLPAFFPRVFREGGIGGSTKGVSGIRRLGIVEVAAHESVSPSNQGELIFGHFVVELRVKFFELSQGWVSNG